MFQLQTLFIKFLSIAQIKCGGKFTFSFKYRLQRIKQCFKRYFSNFCHGFMDFLTSYLMKNSSNIHTAFNNFPFLSEPANTSSFCIKESRAKSSLLKRYLNSPFFSVWNKPQIPNFQQYWICQAVGRLLRNKTSSGIQEETNRQWAGRRKDQ